jgi:ribonuclease HI
MAELEIYTDGAYSSSRDCGGWAFVVIKDGHKIHSDFGTASATTNNRMEIMGVLQALKWAKGKEIIIFSDSMYVIGTMTKNWKRKKNADLWTLMDEAVKDCKVEWKHVKGHNNDKWNSHCDLLAVHGSHIIQND